MEAEYVDDAIRDLVARLAAGYSPQRVILFGSRASGNAGPDSDLDLLVIKDTSDRPIDRWVEVRRILSDPKRSIPVDTLVLTPTEVADRVAMGDQFVAGILESGVVLYDR
jgi:predicted nucleotidyltransferase